MRFSASDTTLRFFVNGVLQLTAQDSSLDWGTTGIRTDYMGVYLDDWMLE